MVSIQLVSPASGEPFDGFNLGRRLDFNSFHSISFPSEWGDSRRSAIMALKVASFHSISFPSEWGVLGQ